MTPRTRARLALVPFELIARATLAAQTVAAWILAQTVGRRCEREMRGVAGDE